MSLLQKTMEEMAPAARFEYKAAAVCGLREAEGEKAVAAAPKAEMETVPVDVAAQHAEQARAREIRESLV